LPWSGWLETDPVIDELDAVIVRFRAADDGVVGRARYGVGVDQPDALAICVATSPPVVARPIAAAPIAAPCARASA
jgi:hypothetical protein